MPDAVDTPRHISNMEKFSLEVLEIMRRNKMSMPEIMTGLSLVVGGLLKNATPLNRAKALDIFSETVSEMAKL